MRGRGRTTDGHSTPSARVADRFLLVGAIGTARDLDGAIAEVDWIADHGFVGSYAPGFVGLAGARPLDDEYWDPFWARCAEREVAMIVHGGYGLTQGYAFDQIMATCNAVDAEGGDDTDLVTALAQGIFSERFFADLQHRQAMWQLMLGGVFDRHPNLKLMMAEVRPTGCPRRWRTSTPCTTSTGPTWRAAGSRATGGSRTASPACRSCTKPRSRSGKRSGSTT